MTSKITKLEQVSCDAIRDDTRCAVVVRSSAKHLNKS